MNTFGGTLLATSDGGRTWKRTPQDPKLAFAEILLVTPSDGWMFGTPTDSEFHGDLADKQLYVTHDGAQHWQKVTLALKEMASADCGVHDLPVFEGAEHGFLQVNCLTRKEGKNNLTLTLFATENGGRSWKPDRSVTNLSDIARQQYETGAIVGSDWIFAAQSDHHPLITKVGAGATIDASGVIAPSGARYGEIRHIDFVTPMEGWVIVGDGQLMSTTNSGSTWTDISPGPKPHVIHPLAASSGESPTKPTLPHQP